MLVRGQVQKLIARPGNPVSYALPLGPQKIDLAPLFEQELSLRHTGVISCVHCGRGTKKSFSQGYCYPCFQKLAQCDSCIISPERCHYGAGSCREPVWGDHFCMQDHIVYFANSSGLKVGITRASQLYTRWMDQGATQALAVVRVRTRQQAGFCEAMFRQHVGDRTNWRAMLSGAQQDVDLGVERDRLLALCETGLQELQQRFGLHAISILTGVEPVQFTYPVLRFPARVASLDLDKEKQVSGRLLGIKGQYLILDSGVINIRKYTGYELELSADASVMQAPPVAEPALATPEQPSSEEPVQPAPPQAAGQIDLL